MSMQSVVYFVNCTLPFETVDNLFDFFNTKIRF